MLTIHLGQDENDCFAAWVSAKEAEINITDDNLRGSYIVKLNNITCSLTAYLYLIFSKLW